MAFEELPPLTLRIISPADNLPVMVEKVQFNFDQILLHGGGRKGDKGDEGAKGVPGATGVGEQGDKGDKGSEIFFTDTDVNDNDLTISGDHREDDILIDTEGDYFKVFKDTFGALRYKFQFNINTASVINPYWIDQDSYYSAPVQTNPTVNEHVLFNFGAPAGIEKNLVVARRSDNGGGFDKSEYYRVLFGMDQYPAVATQNATLFISNILHNDTDTADQQFFAQVGFKYRDSASSNVGANTVWVIYKEESANDRFLFSIENQSVGTYFKHDTSDTDDSSYIIKGANIEFIGQSVDIDTVTEYLNLGITSNQATFTAQRDLILQTDDSVGSGATFGVTFEDALFKVDNFTFDNFDTGGTPPIKWSFTNRLELTVLFDEFDISATKVILDTIAVDLGATTGSTATDLTLNQDLNIIGGKKIDADADIKFSHRIRNRSVEVQANFFETLLLTGVNSPVVYLKEDAGGPYNTFSGVSGMDDNQVITLVAKDEVIIKPTEQGGDIDLITNKNLILSPLQSVTIYKNPTSGNIEQIGGELGGHDLEGEEEFILNNGSPLVELQVGVNTKYQRITSDLTLTTNHEIRLLRNGAKAGNSFFIHFENNFSLNGNTLRITDNTGANIRKDFTEFDEAMIGTSGADGESAMFWCYYTGSQWIVTGFYETLSGFYGNPHDFQFGGDQAIIDADTLSST